MVRPWNTDPRKSDGGPRVSRLKRGTIILFAGIDMHECPGWLLAGGRVYYQKDDQNQHPVPHPLGIRFPSYISPEGFRQWVDRDGNTRLEPRT